MADNVENEKPLFVKTCPWCHWTVIDKLDVFELPYAICEKCGKELEVRDEKEVLVEFKTFKEADELVRQNVEALTPQQRKCVLGTAVNHEKIEIYLDNLLRLTKEDIGALIFMLERITLHELAHLLASTIKEEEIHKFTDRAMVMRLTVKPDVKK